MITNNLFLTILHCYENRTIRNNYSFHNLPCCHFEADMALSKIRNFQLSPQDRNQ